MVSSKHVGITDSDRERLKTSVKTLASWSAHARSTASWQCYLPQKEHRSNLACLARGTGQLSAVLPFVVCNSLQALPHPTSVRAGEVRFDLSPVLTLCLFDGSSEDMARFLISFRVRVPLRESCSSTL